MVKYLVLLKINPAKANDVWTALKHLPQKPWNGVELYYTMNVFGNWDAGLWFYAKNHDYAIDFVHNKIYPINGITETHTIPTTPIKEYTKNWK